VSDIAGHFEYEYRCAEYEYELGEKVRARTFKLTGGAKTAAIRADTIRRPVQRLVLTQ